MTGRRRFGEVAVELGLVDRPAVDRALADQATLAGHGLAWRIGRFLVARGRLTAADVDRVLEAAGVDPAERVDPALAGRMTDDDAIHLGQLVVSTGLISQARIDECLDLLDHLREMGIAYDLGHLLVERGHAGPRTLEALLQVEESVGEGDRGEGGNDEGSAPVLQVLDLDSTATGGTLATTAALIGDFWRQESRQDRLGSILIKNRLLSKRQLKALLVEQRRLLKAGHHRRLGDLAVERGFVTRPVAEAVYVIQRSGRGGERGPARSTIGWSAVLVACLVGAIAAGWFLEGLIGAAEVAGDGVRVEEAPPPPDAPGSVDEYDRLMRARGLVRHEDRWLTPAEAERRIAAAREGAGRDGGLVDVDGEWLAREEVLRRLAVETSRARGLVHAEGSWWTAEEWERHQRGLGQAESLPVEAAPPEEDIAGALPLEARHAVEDGVDWIDVTGRGPLPDGTRVRLEIRMVRPPGGRLARRRAIARQGLVHVQLSGFAGRLFPGVYSVRAEIDPADQEAALAGRFDPARGVYVSRTELVVGSVEETRRATAAEAERHESGLQLLRGLVAGALAAPDEAAEVEQARRILEVGRSLRERRDAFAVDPYRTSRTLLSSCLSRFSWLYSTGDPRQALLDLRAGLDAVAIRFVAEGLAAAEDRRLVAARTVGRILDQAARCVERPREVGPPSDRLVDLARVEPLLVDLAGLRRRLETLAGSGASEEDATRWVLALVSDWLRCERLLLVAPDARFDRPLAAEFHALAGAWLRAFAVAAEEGPPRGAIDPAAGDAYSALVAAVERRGGQLAEVDGQALVALVGEWRLEAARGDPGDGRWTTWSVDWSARLLRVQEALAARPAGPARTRWLAVSATMLRLLEARSRERDGLRPDAPSASILADLERDLEDGR